MAPIDYKPKPDRETKPRPQPPKTNPQAPAPTVRPNVSASSFTGGGMINIAPLPEAQPYEPPSSGGGGDSGGGGGGGGSGPSDQDRADARDQANRDYEDARAAAAILREQDAAMAQIKATFNTYGLSSLYTKIEEYVRKGYTPDTVVLMLRETPEYNARFPAMRTLNGKGRAISEASYVDYETQAAAFEKQFGLPSGMLMGNVTGLLENDVSVIELKDRVTMASAASLQAPQEFKDTLLQYYNIGSGGLAAYWLDPAIASPLLEKQFATAQIGAEALRQNVGLGVDIASQLQSIGVTQDVARTGFENVSRQSGLSSGAGDVASTSTLIQANLAGTTAAKNEVDRVAAARTGRFQQGGSFATNNSGAAGLGSASTK